MMLGMTYKSATQKRKSSFGTPCLKKGSSLSGYLVAIQYVLEHGVSIS